VDFLRSFINIFLWALIICIIARALFSWFNPGFTNPVGRFLFGITEPVLAPIRKVLPSMGMIDFSPIVALVLLQLLKTFLVGGLR
jgi:YggT family protein